MNNHDVRPAHPARTVTDLVAAARVRRRFRQAQIAMARALGEARLSALQYHLLLELAAEGEPGLSQGDLAKRLGVPRTRLSGMVPTLVDLGLITASRASPDRRVVRIRLATSGRRVLGRALEGQRRALAALVASIPPAEMQSMVEWGAREYLRLPHDEGRTSPGPGM